MTRNRECVILTKSANGLKALSNALALLPDDQHPTVHENLNDALHAILIIAEEIRQEWAEQSGQIRR